MRRILLFGLALSILSAACAKAPGSVAGTGDSGIQGRVFLGPMCPVQTAENPCPNKPIAAQVQVTTPDGHRVTTVRSGSDGRFSVALKPGTYILSAIELKGIQFSRPVTVTVAAGRFVQVAVGVDTGIR